MAKFFTKKIVTIPVGLAILIGGSYFMLNRDDKEEAFEVAKVEHVNIKQVVSVTGTVEADPKINLRFQTDGQVNTIPVEVGDFVEDGALLSALDATSLSIKVKAEEADLALARAEYNQEIAGSTDEAILVAEAGVTKANADLDQANQNLENAQTLSDENIQTAELEYESALTDYENALATTGEDIVFAYENAHNTVDDVLNEVDESLREVDNILGVDNTTVNDDFEAALKATDSSFFGATQGDYTRTKDVFESAQNQFAGTSASDYLAMDELLFTVETLLDNTRELLDATDQILADAPLIGDFTADIQEEKRTIIASEIDTTSNSSALISDSIQEIDASFTTEETDIRSLQNDLNEAEQNLSLVKAQADADTDEAEASVAVFEAILLQEEANLAEVKAGPRLVDLEGLQAAIASAEADLALAQYNLSLASMEAPISGIITKINFDKGENIKTTDDFMEMVSSAYEIVANVSETDITKVKLGDPVELTLDAFSFDQIFKAEIIKIDPAETIVQGVIYYQVTAQFTEPQPGIKPGMTANMDIVTGEIENVLGVPIRAVKYDGPRAYVLKVDPSTNETVEVDVEIGIRGNEYIEITNGLKEDDEVVTYVR